MKNIAIIGGGVSGLTAGYLLSKKHNVTLFEKAKTLGGHTATVDISIGDEQHAIDTGFIVFNDRTYPNFLALLAEIGIEKQPTEMSFSVKNIESKLEYNGHNLDTLFAQRRNLFRPKFWLLIKEILRFNKLCKQVYVDKYSDSLSEVKSNKEQSTTCDNNQLLDDGITVGDFLAEHQFNDFFCEHYILPMGAAIWSSSLTKMSDFPLPFFIRFFYNHGLLNIKDRPQWYVIPNGSRSYIAPLTKPFSDRIFLNSQIKGISRTEKAVLLQFENGEIHTFDDVVIACHSDQAKALLSDATDAENKILSAMPYSKNEVVLHTDTTLLPKRPKAWASWNYHLSDNLDRPACVTYDMNILQGLKSKHTFCVTLNQTASIDLNKVLAEFIYHHPEFSIESMNAQKQRPVICGKNNTHFAGAYWYNGFHEDGVRSAVDVAQRFDCFLDQK